MPNIGIARTLQIFWVVTLTCLPGYGVAQQPKEPEFRREEGRFVYEKVQPVELTRKEIISYSVAFLTERFRSGKSVIELRDDELGKIVGDLVLANPEAGMFDGFKAIKTRLIIDAKDGRYRFQATNIVGVDGNGNTPPWGKIEGANQYRLEPLAKQTLTALFADLKMYLATAKSTREF